MDSWATVGGRDYNIMHATAAKQVELLNMIGAPIMARHAQADGDIDARLIFGILLVMPFEKFNAMASIVLYKTFEAGAQAPTNIGDFQDRSTDYYMLAAEAIKANLADFFTFLQDSQSEEASPEKTG